MPLLFLFITAAFSVIVMLLWNWLMPVIFGLTAITFWQALGLFILSRILFGSFRNKRMGSRFGRGMSHLHRKWHKMTPEQREEFIKKRQKFGFGGPFGACKHEKDD